MKYSVIKLSLAVLLFTMVGVGSYFIFKKPYLEKITQPVTVTKRIVSEKVPVILVHGFNQSNQFWKDVDLVDSLEAKSFVHMGDFVSHDKHEEGCEVKDQQEIKAGQSALYTLSMPSLGTLDIKKSAALLAEGIKHATERHQCEKVRLVGFSMGGVVIREYLTSVAQSQHRVEQVITVSSPHSGSEYAWVANLYKEIQNRISVNGKSSKEGWQQLILKKSEKLALEQVKKALDRVSVEFETPVASEAARMLTPPQDGNYLERLNKKEHPVDIDYHCVITEENMLTYHWHEMHMDWKKIKENDWANTNLVAATIDLLRHSLGKFDSIDEAIKKQNFRGDGVVSCYSQDLNNIECFQRSDRLKATTSKLETFHLTANINAVLSELILTEK